MNRRYFARLVAWFLISTLAVACKTLPDASDLPDQASPRAAPTIETAKGALPPRKVSQLTARRWANASPDLKMLAVLEEEATGVPLIAGNKVTLLFDGPATMRAMMEAARNATSTINVETYIFDQDKIGNEFADLLIEKRKQGVVVNVMYDSVGALGTPSAFFDRMRAAGINVLAFNPVNPAARPGKWELNNRDHRKVMVVDGKIGFTGGINISSTYANSSFFRSRQKPEKNGHQKVGWRDTDVMIEGPAVAAMQYAFINNWVRQQAGELIPANYFPPVAAQGNMIVRVLASEPDQPSSIYKALLIAIGEAKKSIHIEAAYFVPDDQVIDALRAAAKRGVDVKLVLPGVSDHSLVFHAGQSYYEPLLEAGVQVYQLKVAILHAKTAVIDSAWSTIGSANIDRRSFIHNYELNVVVMDPAFGENMESAFDEDLRDSKRVTLEQWRKRPLSDRFMEWLGRMAEYWI